MAKENSVDRQTADHRSGTLLMDAEGLARELGISVKSVRRLDASGKLPRPIRLSRRVIRWRRVTIDRWLVECEAAGGRLVDRREFEALQSGDGHSRSGGS